MADAASEKNETRQSIGRACNGLQEKAGVFKWKFAEKKPILYQKKVPVSHKPVISTDTEGNKTRYKTMTDAERETGIARSSIRAVCNGDREDVEGLFWEYEEKE